MYVTCGCIWDRTSVIYIYVHILFYIHIQNISMYRFFSGIAGRKDVGKSLVTLGETRRPSSFVFADEHRAFARKSDHAAPLNAKMQNRDVRPSYARRSSVPRCLYDSFLRIISFRRKTKQGEEANQTGSHYEAPNVRAR